MPSDDEADPSYFPTQLSPNSKTQPPNSSAPQPASLAPSSMAAALRKRPPERKPTEEDIERWTQESGMGAGRQADALGDDPSQQDEVQDEASDQDAAQAFGQRIAGECGGG